MIYIGSDHAGFSTKEALKTHLESKGIEYTDLGTHSEDSVDYPDIAHAVAKEVVKHQSKGVLICGSGTGICIAANKVKGIRAAHCISKDYAKMARLHNDANIVCIAGREKMIDSAEEIVDTFLTTEFDDQERRVRRNQKLTELENAS